MDTITISKTARGVILAGAREVGRAYKVAFTYMRETDPVVAAKFLKKLTLQTRHAHIDAPHITFFKPAKYLTP
jgi:hypothetical protein